MAVTFMTLNSTFRVLWCCHFHSPSQLSFPPSKVWFWCPSAVQYSPARQCEHPKQRWSWGPAKVRNSSVKFRMVLTSSAEMNLSSQPPQYTPSRIPLNPHCSARFIPPGPKKMAQHLAQPDMKQFGSQEGGRRKWWGKKDLMVDHHFRWHINWTYIISYITVYISRDIYR